MYIVYYLVTSTCPRTMVLCLKTGMIKSRQKSAYQISWINWHNTVTEAFVCVCLHQPECKQVRFPVSSEMWVTDMYETLSDFPIRLPYWMTMLFSFFFFLFFFFLKEHCTCKCLIDSLSKSLLKANKIDKVLIIKHNECFVIS